MDADEQATMAMKCIVQMQPVYERCRELCGLADSNTNYRLAVVNRRPLSDVTSSNGGRYRRVVKMEGDDVR